MVVEWLEDVFWSQIVFLEVVDDRERRQSLIGLGASAGNVMIRKGLPLQLRVYVLHKIRCSLSNRR